MPDVYASHGDHHRLEVFVSPKSFWIRVPIAGVEGSLLYLSIFLELYIVSTFNGTDNLQKGRY